MCKPCHFSFHICEVHEYFPFIYIYRERIHNLCFSKIEDSFSLRRPTCTAKLTFSNTITCLEWTQWLFFFLFLLSIVIVHGGFFPRAERVGERDESHSKTFLNTDSNVSEVQCLWWFSSGLFFCRGIRWGLLARNTETLCRALVCVSCVGAREDVWVCVCALTKCIWGFWMSPLS